jgi:hypothetical protein
MEKNETITPVSFLFYDILNHLKPILTVENELILFDKLKMAQEMEEKMNKITWVDSALLVEKNKTDYEELVNSFAHYYTKKYKSWNKTK